MDVNGSNTWSQGTDPRKFWLGIMSEKRLSCFTKASRCDWKFQLTVFDQIHPEDLLVAQSHWKRPSLSKEIWQSTKSPLVSDKLIMYHIVCNWCPACTASEKKTVYFYGLIILYDIAYIFNYIYAQYTYSLLTFWRVKSLFTLRLPLTSTDMDPGKKLAPKISHGCFDR